MSVPGFSFAATHAPPPGSHFYEINSTKVTLSEFFYEATNPISFLLLLFIVPFVKLFRFHLPATSTDDVPVELLDPFIIPHHQFPIDIWNKISTQVADLEALGFKVVQYHVIHDANFQTDTYFVTLFGPGNVAARVHFRVWPRLRPPKQKLFFEFTTRLLNNNYVWSTSGRPDMMAPPNCVVVTKTGASAATLLKLHETAVTHQNQIEQIVHTPEDACELINWRHCVVRDFHLNRGVFRQPRGYEYRHRDIAAIETMQPHESRYQHILIEIYKIQAAKNNWKHTIGLLLLSGLLFYAMTQGGWDQKDFLYIIPILFFHELGHFLSMKTFGYSNLRMFFIPGFGAAVSGNHYNVSGWKKTIVALAGPVPGIALGIGLGIYGTLTTQTTLIHIAVLLLVINGFNLLPILPLDGGHVVYHILLSRHYVLDLLFRLFAALCLIPLGLAIGGPFTVALGVGMLIGIPSAVRLGKIIRELRREDIAAPSLDSQTIPPAVADKIIDKLSENSRKTPSNKVMAQRTLSVFEGLNCRPPGWIASYFLFSTYSTAIVTAFLGLVVFVLAENGTVQDFLRNIRNFTNQPHHLVNTDTLPAVPKQIGGNTYKFAGPERECTVVASFKTEAAATAQATTLSATLPRDAVIRQFAETLFITYPEDLKTGAARLVETLNPLTKDLFTQNSTQATGLRLTAVAPTPEIATALRTEITEYLATTKLAPHTAPPWQVTPWLTPQEYAAARLARTTLLLLRKGASAFDGDSTPANKQISEALRRCDLEATKTVTGRERNLRSHFVTPRVETLQKMPETAVDLPFLAALASDAAVRPDFLLKILPPTALIRLGNIPESEWPTPQAAATAQWGTATANGTTLNLNLSLPAGELAAPAIVRWLKEKGCLDFHYDFFPAPKALANLDTDGFGNS